MKRGSTNACAAVALIIGLMAGTAWAETRVDPDWPCIQRKVPTLSVGQMWPGQPPEGNWRDDPEVRKLAEAIAVRRTSLEQVATLAADYAATLPSAERPGRMALLFSGVLDRIDAERGQLISGISRYAHKQAEASERVKARETELAALKTAPDPDLDKIEELQDMLIWDVRVYRERSQSLSFVCETPVLLEQRAFAIARILAGDG